MRCFLETSLFMCAIQTQKNFCVDMIRQDEGNSSEICCKNSRNPHSPKKRENETVF